MFQINWKLKAFIYKVLELFRLKKTFFLIQYYITKRSRINIKEISFMWKSHAESIYKNNCKSLLEVGAGKSLAQNIFFSYHFNNKLEQTAVDIIDMLDFKLFNDASDQIASVLNLKKRGHINNLNELKSKYNITYKAPFKISDLYDTHKYDISVNTTALEHFKIEDIKLYLDNLRRIIKNGGYVSSLIDYTDHYSHTDNQISTFNFLKYSTKDWSKYNNSYLFQNRLRHQDYKKIFTDNKLDIIEEKKGKLSDPPNDISGEFNIKNKDTFVTWGYFLKKID